MPGSLNNVGMYVRIVGEVSDSANGRFWVDDGSGVRVLVKAPGLQLPADGTHVMVKGACGLTLDGASNIATIRPASDPDIVPY